MKAYPEATKARAQTLAASGLSCRAVSAKLGIPHHTIYRWLNPEYEARHNVACAKNKAKYGGKCARCGGKTSHGNARTRGKASRHCKTCASAIATENAFWTRERLIETAQRWTLAFGAPPSARAWRRAGWAVDADGRFPYPNFADCYATGHYGRKHGWATWNDFLRAAGLPTWRRGQHGKAERQA